MSTRINFKNFLKLQNVHKTEIKNQKDKIHPSDMKHPSGDQINTQIKIKSFGKARSLNLQGNILLLAEDKPMITLLS